MNYRHAYHAGNFADVVKHVLLIQLLNQMMEKPKPLQYLDAYAGRGMYKLNSAEAKRTGEAKKGVKAVFGSLGAAPAGEQPEAIAQYINLINRARKQYGDAAYPGSPWFAQQLLREDVVDKKGVSTGVGDVGHAFEYNEDEYDHLKDTFFRVDNMGVHHRDAFEGINAFTPPAKNSPHRRGLVLIDPPYEQEHKDFTALVRLLDHAMKKWPQGVYALWYPIKDRSVVDLFEKKMKRTGIKNQLVCDFCVLPDDTPIGLNGTGMLIINPPWQFADHADRILQYLLPILRMQEHMGHAAVRWLVGEK